MDCLQKQQSDTIMTCLPKPLPASDVVETSLPKDSVEEPNRVQDKEVSCFVLLMLMM